MLKKFKVFGSIVGSKYLGVYEVENAEEAIEKALDKAKALLCPQCSFDFDDLQISEAIAEEVEE